eukprot:SM000093S24429  [mRNA]  locus=s93:329430:332360:+ [translate_table: standard]
MTETYSPGYEPSAPPAAPEALGYSHNRAEEGTFGPGSGVYLQPDSALNRSSHGSYTRNDEGQETILGRLLGALWGTSHTVARIDLRRPPKFQRPFRSRDQPDDIDGVAFTQNSGYPRSYYGQPPGTISQGGRQLNRPPPPAGGYFADRRTMAGSYLTPFGNLLGLNGFQGEGARLKLMQVWDFPDKFTGQPSLPYGATLAGMTRGFNYEMDTSSLQPKLRLRAKHAALHLLPLPELELRGKWPIGETNLAVDIRYKIPVARLDKFYDPSEARVMLNLFNPLGSGVHLTPGGLEFDEQVVRIGQHTNLRLAATVDFPRRFPLEEGEQPFLIRMHRLGIKTTLF